MLWLYLRVEAGWMQGKKRLMYVKGANEQRGEERFPFLDEGRFLTRPSTQVPGPPRQHHRGQTRHHEAPPCPPLQYRKGIGGE